MNVHYEVRQRVAVIQIDNPPVNGLGHAVRKGIAEGIERALDDPTVDAIVITGTGRVFSGGADIREFNTPLMVATPTLLDLIVAVESAFKPVISAINGVCMGGGLELSLACHYRVATPKASMGLPESKIGLIPGAGGPQRLPRAVGAALALRMITTGDPIRADQALDALLALRVVQQWPVAHGAAIDDGGHAGLDQRAGAPHQRVEIRRAIGSARGHEGGDRAPEDAGRHGWNSATATGCRHDQR